MLALAKIMNTHNAANDFIGKILCGAWEKRYQMVLILQTKANYSSNKQQPGRTENSLLGSEVCEHWEEEETSADRGSSSASSHPIHINQHYSSTHPSGLLYI